MGTILIFGSNGLISTQIIPILLSNKSTSIIGVDIHEDTKIHTDKFQYVQANIFNISEVKSILANNSITSIIYTIGIYGQYTLDKMVSINAIAILNVFNSLINPAPKILVISSASVYGPKHINELPINEDSLRKPNSDYGYAKFFLEEICMHYRNVYNYDITVLRLSNIIADRMSPKLLVGKIISQIKDQCNNDNITLNLFNKSGKRDYITPKIFGEVLNKLLQLKDIPALLNIGSGTLTSIMDLVSMFEIALSKKINVATESETENKDYASHYFDTSLLCNIIGTDKDTFANLCVRDVQDTISNIINNEILNS